MTYHIIQPTTWERNLSGICYMPYWLYTAFKEDNRPVVLYEDAKLREADKIIAAMSKDDILLIDLSSYPQVSLAREIYRAAVEAEIRAEFIGYNPLIEALSFPVYDIEGDGIDILNGVFNYIYYSEDFKYALLSDCDNHLKSINDYRKVVPLFLSIGCKRGCPYCYVSHSNYPFGKTTQEHTLKLLDYIISKNWNVHFIDENFFANPHLDAILEHLQGKGLKYICLTDTLSLVRAIEKYGEDYLLNSGNALNEVGLETISTEVLDKKQNITPLLTTSLRVFWLTVTFLPNESLKSLNDTGAFLQEHGYEKEELLPRIRTNSTVGGLGQFFQLYHNTPYWKKKDSLGKVFTEYPTRLYPSFVGFPILREVPVKLREVSEKDFGWLDLYLTPEKVLEVLQAVDGVSSVGQIIQNNPERLIAIAQLARLNIITGG